jgi:hypothetical protein
MTPACLSDIKGSKMLRVHLDGGHHAQVLMGQNVTVVDEGSYIHAAKVHEQLYLRDGNTRLAHPEGHLYHVQKLAVDGGRRLGAIGLEVVLRENLEMYLVHVEFMGLLGYVLNDPSLHGSLRGHHRRRIVVVEHDRCLAELSKSFR